MLSVRVGGSIFVLATHRLNINSANGFIKLDKWEFMLLGHDIETMPATIVTSFVCFLANFRIVNNRSWLLSTEQLIFVCMAF